MNALFFQKYPQLLLAISTKSDGAMRTKNQLENNSLETRETFLKNNGLSYQEVVSAELVHGNTIYSK